MQNELNSEQERVLAQRAGHDSKAFHTLYQLYFERVYRYVAAKVNNPFDAEDLVSAIFLQVVKGLPQLKNRHQFSFAAWLFTIARNVVTDFYRQQGYVAQHLTTLNGQDASIAYDELDERVMEQERAAELRAVLDKLPERRREIIILKYFSGLRNLEIALILNLDERTVASHLSRGLKDMYEIYTKAQGEVEGTHHDEHR